MGPGSTPRQNEISMMTLEDNNKDGLYSKEQSITLPDKQHSSFQLLLNKAIAESQKPDTRTKICSLPRMHTTAIQCNGSHLGQAPTYAMAGEMGNEFAIIDSGASHHITSVEVHLTKSGRPFISGIKDIGGNVSRVTAMGTVGNLKNVMLVPSSKTNLISVGSYLDQFEGAITFTQQEVFHQLNNHRTLLGTRSEDGLYLF